jgi:hypothetical protein
MSESASNDSPSAATTDYGACGNCGTPLLGPHCYACGQPVKGLVRHFTSIIGDFLDSVFNFDARTPRTLWPLFVRPGFLTREYFEGRRVRYVSPVRLFFFLAIVTFFFAQLTVSFGDDVINLDGNSSGNDAIARATTIAEVEKQRDLAVAELRKARKELEGTPAIGANPGLIAAETTIRKRAGDRIAQLREAEKSGKPPPVDADAEKDKDDEDFDIAFNGRTWDPKTNPVEVTWLPGFANDWLNAQIGRTKKNIVRIREDKDLFKDALLGAVPSTLFVMLPVFALMLKAFYLFKRRLYMEHLIVALHSHAFLCLALLLMFVTMALQRWLAPHDGFLRALFNLVEAALWIWMPVYLLLMQKRIYGQGWIMTLLKYSVLGIFYLVLLSFGAAFTVLASVVWM